MSSKPPIPKEQMSAYQRWELSSFDEVPPAPVPVSDPGVKLPTAEDIERIQQQAYQEGFAAGMKDAQAQGEALARHMQQLLVELDRSIQQFESAMADEILALSLEVAQRLVRQAIGVNPKIVMAVVREAIESLPQVNQGPVITLHPEDADLIRQMLAHEYRESVWRVVDDPQMQRGGCRIETGASEIDATMDSRWKRIVAALGSNAIWHED
jgi:flagellar assembly protein FliH